MSMDMNGNNLNYNGVYPARIESIGVLENGQVSTTSSTNFPSYVSHQTFLFTYVFDSKSRLFETDSSQTFANELYSVTGGSVGDVLIDHLYIDDANQELYFLTSPNGSAGATHLMKTSLSNFDPQLIYIIPNQMNHIYDFDINPITGEFYWCMAGNQWGVYYYQVSTNQVINIVPGSSGQYFYDICFDTNGDLFYTIAGTLYDSQGNSIYSGSNHIHHVVYYPPTNSFIIGSDNQIFDDQGNILFTSPTGGGGIYDLDINYTTQRILFNTEMATMSMDMNGNNLNYNGVYPARIESIVAIE
jgi:hypothetical protein